jgi:hypothetical protein
MADGVAQVLECLLSKCGALSSSPNTTKKKKEQEKCLTLLTIREMQIKTTLRFHFTPV